METAHKHQELLKILAGKDAFMDSVLEIGLDPYWISLDTDYKTLEIGTTNLEILIDMGLEAESHLNESNPSTHSWKNIIRLSDSLIIFSYTKKPLQTNPYSACMNGMPA